MEIKTKLVRYNDDCYISGESSMCESEYGDWVKYEDIKHLLSSPEQEVNVE